MQSVPPLSCGWSREEQEWMSLYEEQTSSAGYVQILQPNADEKIPCEHSNHGRYYILTEILCMDIVCMNILFTISSSHRQASFSSWCNSCPASLILLSLSLLLHRDSQSLKGKKMNMLDEMAAWMNLGKSGAWGYEMWLVKWQHKYTLYTLVVISCLSHSLTKASSGSALGSTPKSKSLAPRPRTAPPSPARIGEDSRASARLGPGGTVTRWEPAPSLPFSVVTKAVSFSVFNSCKGQEKKHKIRASAAEDCACAVAGDRPPLQSWWYLHWPFPS